MILPDWWWSGGSLAVCDIPPYARKNFLTWKHIGKKKERKGCQYICCWGNSAGWHCWQFGFLIWPRAMRKLSWLIHFWPGSNLPFFLVACSFMFILNVWDTWIPTLVLGKCKFWLIPLLFLSAFHKHKSPQWEKDSWDVGGDVWSTICSSFVE